MLWLWQFDEGMSWSSLDRWMGMSIGQLGLGSLRCSVGFMELLWVTRVFVNAYMT